MPSSSNAWSACSNAAPTSAVGRLACNFGPKGCARPRRATTWERSARSGCVTITPVRSSGWRRRLTRSHRSRCKRWLRTRWCWASPAGTTRRSRPMTSGWFCTRKRRSRNAWKCSTTGRVSCAWRANRCWRRGIYKPSSRPTGAASTSASTGGSSVSGRISAAIATRRWVSCNRSSRTAIHWSAARRATGSVAARTSRATGKTL